MLDAACTSLSIITYWLMSASKMSPTSPSVGLNSVSTTGLPSSEPDGEFGSEPGPIKAGYPPTPTTKSSRYNCGITLELIYQTELLLLRGCIRAHMLIIFSVTMVSASCPASMSTSTSAPLFRIPRGPPTPAPFRMSSLTMKSSSSLAPWRMMPASAVVSCNSSSVA